MQSTMAHPRAIVSAGSRHQLRRRDGRTPGERAGAAVETWHINRLIESPAELDHFQILTIPGGFSYGDDLGAGRILATRIGTVLGEALRRFHDRGGLILGICNGFQVLVRSGLLPGGPSPCPTTLAHNDSGRFEARWVRLLPRPGLLAVRLVRRADRAARGPRRGPIRHGRSRRLWTTLEQQRPDRLAIRRPRRPADAGLSRQSQRLGPRPSRASATRPAGSSA